jgi:hypothetical protein
MVQTESKLSSQFTLVKFVYSMATSGQASKLEILSLLGALMTPAQEDGIEKYLLF